MTVKKAGGGANAWGKMGSELKYQDDKPYLNAQDPNFDPLDEAAQIVPNLQAEANFVSSAADLKYYKRTIKDAVTEYVTSGDSEEFVRVVVDLDMTVYHQELTKIIVSKALDYGPEDRAKLSNLLAHLHSNGHLTQYQSKAGFLKIYHRLDEVRMDAPNALTVLKEFQDHAVDNGFLEAADIQQFDVEAKLSSDSKSFASFKKQCKDLVTEYFSSADTKDVSLSVQELGQPELGHEVVKRMVYAGCDGNDRCRELVSVFLAEVPESVIAKDQIAKGFTILLERTEDMFLDTPNIFNLLSTFIARAVVDEALPPAFVVRQDLEERDMGFQVVDRAAALLKQTHASQKLAAAWEEPRDLA